MHFDLRAAPMLGRLRAHSYQLLAQLTAVTSILLRRRGHLNLELIREPLTTTATQRSWYGGMRW